MKRSRLKYCVIKFTWSHGHSVQILFLFPPVKAEIKTNLSGQSYAWTISKQLMDCGTICCPSEISLQECCEICCVKMNSKNFWWSSLKTLKSWSGLDFCTKYIYKNVIGDINWQSCWLSSFTPHLIICWNLKQKFPCKCLWKRRHGGPSSVLH